MSGPVKLRCAIYTRKSTEEGLDQAYNSLDAQRDACAAYIASQMSFGWTLVLGSYDDGGISGGTMQRPGLKRLLTDIAQGRVDVVVVYKIDRLTRSLMDFAKMVEIFDRHGVSFVSVTQQFNTTTSMGRLTLNVLLSFAQFEREVTAERIRDKIAASKAKGMWMGGTVPLGYSIKDRKLAVETSAAVEVQRIFDRYLELGSVPALAAELNRGEWGNIIRADTGQGRRRTPSKVWSGKLYYMLANPIYVGKVRHAGQLYVGEHQLIIEQDVFDKVQQRLADQSPRPRGVAPTPDVHLLNGLLFDETGDRLSPVHATKGDRRYRYYISSRLKGKRVEHVGGWRLPAREIETIVLEQFRLLLADKQLIAAWLTEAGHSQAIESAFVAADQNRDRLCSEANPQQLSHIMQLVFHRIDLSQDRLRLSVNRHSVIDWLMGKSIHGNRGATKMISHKDATALGQDKLGDAIDRADHHVAELPLSIKQRGVERKLVIEGEKRQPDQSLISLIGRAHAYRDAFADRSCSGRKEVAERFNVHPEDVSRLLPLAFLAPRIVEAIFTGTQPADLTARHLARGFNLPMCWTEQSALFSL